VTDRNDALSSAITFYEPKRLLASVPANGGDGHKLTKTLAGKIETRWHYKSPFPA
jgi:hypothetical protein